MKKVNVLIELLKAAKCSVEFKTIYTYSDGNINAQIGVRYPGKHVYHWFDVSIHNTQGCMFISFSQSYSMNTGVTARGVMHGLKVAAYISKMIGTEITGQFDITEPKPATPAPPVTLSQITRLIKCRYVGTDCERIVTDIFGSDTMTRHLVYKLTNYCNVFNSEHSHNTLNWGGFANFVISLDNERCNVINQWAADTIASNPA